MFVCFINGYYRIEMGFLITFRTTNEITLREFSFNIFNPFTNSFF